VDDNYLGEFDVGDARTIWVDFRNALDAAADPTTVTLQVRRPDGSIYTPSVSHPSLGRYEAVVDITQHGRWDIHWAGLGAIKEAVQSWFRARRNRATQPSPTSSA